MRRYLLCLLLLVACHAPSSSQSPQVEEGIYTLANVRLSGAVTNIVIERQTIQAIGKDLRGQTIDCSGLTVLPGFIDAHVHLGFFQPAAVLHGGLTTVRDLGWKPELAFAWAKQSRTEPSWGPRVLAVGPMITVPGGYPSRAGWAPPGTAVFIEDGLVQRLADSGAAAVKVTLEPGAGKTLSESQLKRLTEQAHRRGLRVTAHVSTVGQLKKAVAAGVDELAHFLFDSSEVPKGLLEQMVAKDMTVIPTLRVNPSTARLSNLERFHELGGRIVYGTDLGNGGQPGIDVTELKLMQRAGMSTQEVIDSATGAAADYLGLEDRGQVEVGKVADLILVSGDPYSDFEVLSEPKMVVREGRVVKRSF